MSSANIYTFDVTLSGRSVLNEMDVRFAHSNNNNKSNSNDNNNVSV